MNVVRIWYRKTGTAKYMSHLDLIRVMGRAFHRSKVPIWYTEGFNPRPFMTFSLPLSLGFTGLKESMDVKMETAIPAEEIIGKLNGCLPEGIRVYSVTDAVMKPGEIAFARFEMIFSCEALSARKLFELISTQMEKKELVVEKRSKKGMQLFDLKTAVSDYTLSVSENGVEMGIILPAGSTLNVNPSLFTEAFRLYTGRQIDAGITRTDVFNQKLESFH